MFMKRKGAACAGAALACVASLFIAGCSENSASKAAASSEQIVIEPHVAVGKVHAGMTIPQVIAQLGEPERKTSSAVEYTSLGFAVMPNSNGTVATVLCGDVTGVNGPLVRVFKGRTKEGVGMLSTRAEVVQAYGEPTADQKFRGNLESMQYPAQGLTFTLEGGKVHHMIVRLGQTADQPRTINIETTPASEQK